MTPVMNMVMVTMVITMDNALFTPLFVSHLMIGYRMKASKTAKHKGISRFLARLRITTIPISDATT